MGGTVHFGKSYRRTIRESLGVGAITKKCVEKKRGEGDRKN